MRRGNPYSPWYALRHSQNVKGHGLPHQCAHWFAMTVENPTLHNHPTSDFMQRRLFNECYEPIAVRAVSMSPAEAVLAASHGCMEGAFCFQRSDKNIQHPARRRTGLNRVNCTDANS